MPARAGTDTGGTFTDLVAADGQVAKVLSTRDDPGRAVVDGLSLLPGEPPAVLAHGTTVATNALLERRGAVVAIIATEGLGDLIEIARQDRPSLYDLTATRPDPLVPRHLRYEVLGRLAADGSELRPLDLTSLPTQLPAEVEAVAVCLLHSDIEPRHEHLVESELRARGLDVSRSSVVSPEVREYERAVTTTLNAYLRPTCRAYLLGLSAAAERVVVLTSAGGVRPSEVVAGVPVSLLLSGPAGGVLAGAGAAAANGLGDVVTFDMGGTSTDVCLVLGGRPAPAAVREVAGLPVRVPSLDVHTIGSGGGSIATIDAGGALVVGPRSAGADPGPACYGSGGVEPTVTDADLVAGHLPTGVALPDVGELDAGAARRALDAAGLDAEGVLAVADAQMVQAIRAVSTERGVDPRGLALVAFGGAGPLHACALAEALEMRHVLVPARAGVLSAVGVMCAPHQVDLVRSWPTPLDLDGLDEGVRDLAERARAAVVAEAGGGEAAARDLEVAVQTALDCRYEGQSHELRVPRLEDFHDEHERRNGYRRDGHPVEVVALRATANLPSDVSLEHLPVPDHRLALAGEVIEGPRALVEPDCTIWIPEGWRAHLGEAGALLLTHSFPSELACPSDAGPPPATPERGPSELACPNDAVPPPATPERGGGRG